ncbi:type II CAAX endopeptidase family protein [Citricoccus sp.]|uniref:CPBP family intramembrane glutamic endopeptidase n=1 Tax=Citricoccus sp. TaxID=1978372 RepID=UPI0028BF518D|nr:type II CAAX endopeptidase family protein [Citricoccus sp.]
MQPAPSPAPLSKPPTSLVPKTPFWSRPSVRASTMVVIFAALMIVTNSAASALGSPAAALLIGPVLGVLVLWLYSVAVRRIEQRPVIELARPTAAKRLLLGTLGGLTLACVSIGFIAAFGGYQIIGWGTLAGALTIVGMMFAVAVAEEVLFRGVIFRLVQQRWGTWMALAASALLFGLVHLVNPGATLWGALTLAVEAGLMLGAAYVATGSLWLPIGLHLGWNITTVAIFGTIGSGGDAREALVEAVTPGPVWLTGGSFGPEASLISVAVCSIATVLLLISAHRNGPITHPQKHVSTSRTTAR